MAKSLIDDVAVTASCMIKTGTTFATIYGCNAQQERKIRESLQKAGDSVQHPLLVFGMLAEIERDCLMNRVEQLLDKFVHRTESLRNDTRDRANILNSKGEKPADILDLYDDSRDLVKLFQEVKTKLSKIIDHIEDIPSIFERRCCQMMSGRTNNKESTGRNSKKRRLIQTGLRIRERLLEIMEEYDSKIEDCRTVLQDLTVTTQILSAATDVWIDMLII